MIDHKKQFEILKYLVEECGFDLNRRNSKTGKTPFILFTKYMYGKKHEMFMYMLEKGARVDPCDKHEFTSNMTSCCGFEFGKDEESLIKTMDAQIELLQFCFDKNLLDDLNNVKSVFHQCLLTNRFNSRLYNWLKSHGAKTTDCEEPILVKAFVTHVKNWCQNQHDVCKSLKKNSLILDEDLISMLEADGFSWTQVDKNGNNILHMLLLQSILLSDSTKVYVDIIRFLKSKGLDIIQLCKQENNQKITPLDNAHLSSYKNSFKSFLKDQINAFSLFN